MLHSGTSSGKLNKKKIKKEQLHLILFLLGKVNHWKSSCHLPGFKRRETSKSPPLKSFFLFISSIIK